MHVGIMSFHVYTERKAGCMAKSMSSEMRTVVKVLQSPVRKLQGHIQQQTQTLKRVIQICTIRQTKNKF